MPVSGIPTYHLLLVCLIICNQGFVAEIPEAYLLALQTNLQQPESEIAYIGKADAI